MTSRDYIIGIDEVGRGALAGPVVVAAAIVPRASRKIIADARLGTLKDSKQLSPAQREAWFRYFKKHGQVHFAVARVYPRGIERMNISAAANRAAEKALAALGKKIAHEQPRIHFTKIKIILDGGLYIGTRARQHSRYPKNAITVPKADETRPAVAVASIIAKVTRDRFMVRLAQKYNAYGFDVHKGYGTLAHRKAITKTGPCAAHRLTFLTKKPIMK
jgi:ribonuclease HII